MTPRIRAGAVALAVAAGVLAPAAAPAAVAACLPDPAGIALEASGAAPFTEDPEAGWWRTWTTPVTAVDVPPPPQTASVETAAELAELHASALARTPDRLAAIERWDDGGAAHAWTEVFLGIIKAASTAPAKNPPRISRDIAIVQTAIFDALAVTWKAKHCYRRPAPWALDPALPPAAQRRPAPSYPSEHAAVAGVMWHLMPALYGEPVGHLVAEATSSRIWGGANYRSDVRAGLEIGAAVARAALAARADDGSGAVWDGSGRITGTCNWEPTPPAFAYPPAEPMWGSVEPWLLSTGGQVRPAPPPACDSEEYLAAARDVYETSLRLNDRQKEIALYWAGGPGTETPPGMNLRTAMNAAHVRGTTTMREARVLAHVGAALADAAIAAWDAKYASWWDRPATTIRRLYDPAWTSFIGTPPFPGYVSGHSTFSGSAMHVLAGFFPDAAIEFRAMATEAAISRFYGGIHARYDNEVGLEVGHAVGDAALARAAGDGA